MYSVRKRQRGNGFWSWTMAAGLFFVAVFFFASQAFSTSMTVTVTADDLTDAITDLPVFEPDWTAQDAKAHTITLNLSGGTITTVDVSGKQKQAPNGLRVELLDGGASIISQACVTITGANFSATADVPDVLYSNVVRVKAIGLTTC